MARPIPIDRDWLAAHPLPQHPSSADKDGRGHVLIVGGSRKVPGGLRLTAEGALRAGAGRVQLATLDSLALLLGVAVPEAGILALGEDGEGELNWQPNDSVSEALNHCDCAIIGPAMTSTAAATPIVRAILDNQEAELNLILDAVAINSNLCSRTSKPPYDKVVLTPNAGEMARLLGTDVDHVGRDPQSAILESVARTGVTIMLKGPDTLIATRAGELLSYSEGHVGLATGGSGDVLAGILGGLLARGANALAACAWAAWLHGEAGRKASEQSGPLGYLARELPNLVPALM